MDELPVKTMPPFCGGCSRSAFSNAAISGSHFSGAAAPLEISKHDTKHAASNQEEGIFIPASQHPATDRQTQSAARKRRDRSAEIVNLPAEGSQPSSCRRQLPSIFR